MDDDLQGHVLDGVRLPCVFFIPVCQLSPADASKCGALVDKIKPVFGDTHQTGISSLQTQAFITADLPQPQREQSPLPRY